MDGATVSSSATVTWVEPCWCCGAYYTIGECADDCNELMGYCEPCDMWCIADSVAWMEDGGKQTVPPQFDPATGYRSCLIHDKSEGSKGETNDE